MNGFIFRQEEYYILLMVDKNIKHYLVKEIALIYNFIFLSLPTRHHNSMH